MTMTAKTINHKAIRSENRKKILQLVQKERELTIQEISRELDISVPTVTRVIEQLEEEGLAQNAGVSESIAGRRPKVIRFAPDAYYTVGVEFADESVRLALTNLDSAIVAEAAIARPNYHELDGVMQAVRQETDAMLQAHSIAPARILGIGFSLPGLVDERHLLLKIAPNFGIRQVDFAQYQRVFGFPIFIENEANAAAIAELRLGVAKEMRNLVHVSVLPQGIGAGIIIGGELYRGKNKRAGEYGHTCIVPRGLLCSCGRFGCWERYASANVLLTSYAEQTGAALRDLPEFFARMRERDAAAVAVFDTFTDFLALGIQNILLAHDPHYIVIGGVISPFRDDIFEPLRQKIFVENTFYAPQDVNIRWTMLKENASMLGASLLPVERVFSDPVTPPRDSDA